MEHCKHCYTDKGFPCYCNQVRCHICDLYHTEKERCPHCHAYVINPIPSKRKGMSRFPMPVPPAIPRRVGDAADQETARTINHGA